MDIGRQIALRMSSMALLTSRGKGGRDVGSSETRWIGNVIANIP
jgi:hypothetical protein